MEEYGRLLYDSGFTLDDAKLQLMGVNTVSVACQFAEENSSLRCHYTIPLGNQKPSHEKGIQRIDKVRDALNSTSIGQERLDFHWHCRSLVHWNLPSNPIDIE